MGTAVSEIVGIDLGWRLVDNDESLQRRTGVAEVEFSARIRLDALHRVEAEVLIVVLETAESAVTTAASSSVREPVARRLLRRRAFVVWLDASPAVLAARMASGSHRPSVGDPGPSGRGSGGVGTRSRGIDRRRGGPGADAPFRKVADLIPDTSEQTPREVAGRIGRALGRGRSRGS
jgi:shikimate kinase